MLGLSSLSSLPGVRPTATRVPLPLQQAIRNSDAAIGPSGGAPLSRLMPGPAASSGRGGQHQPVSQPQLGLPDLQLLSGRPQTLGVQQLTAKDAGECTATDSAVASTSAQSVGRPLQLLGQIPVSNAVQRSPLPAMPQVAVPTTVSTGPPATCTLGGAGSRAQHRSSPAAVSLYQHRSCHTAQVPGDTGKPAATDSSRCFVRSADVGS